MWGRGESRLGEGKHGIARDAYMEYNAMQEKRKFNNLKDAARQA